MISVFDYTDFRKFLRDYLKACKSEGLDLTYTSICERAGFRSPGFITQLIQGKSNISEKLIPAFAKALELDERSRDYFGHMVRYNQADIHDTKRAYFEKMLSFREARVGKIDADMYAVFDRWYYVAIRAVLSYYRFSGDYGALGRMTVPPIHKREAQRAVTVLKRLGLITEQDDGSLQVTKKHLSTGLETDSIIVNNYVINTLEIARDAFYRFPKEARSFSSLTVSISGEGYGKMRDAADAFRKQVVEIVAGDNNLDRTYQLNIQLFPLSPLPANESCEEGGK